MNTFVNLNTVSGSASLKSILLLLLVVLIHFPNCGHSAKLHSSQKQHRQRFVPSIGNIKKSYGSFLLSGHIGAFLAVQKNFCNFTSQLILTLLWQYTHQNSDRPRHTFCLILVKKNEKIWPDQDLNPQSVDQKLIVLTITP